MRVKMLQLAAGPLGVWDPGGVIDLDAKTAAELVAAGAAVAVEEPGGHAGPPVRKPSEAAVLQEPRIGMRKGRKG
jgi:hypothetical protein